MHDSNTHNLKIEVNLYEIYPPEKRDKLERFLRQLSEHLVHDNLYTQMVENIKDSSFLQNKKGRAIQQPTCLPD